MKKSKNQDHYKKYLSSMHSKWMTSDEIIKEIVEGGTGKQLISRQRIIAGEANEVYDITLEDNQHVILRISSHGYPDFIQEKWAIEKTQRVGVPAPKILFIKHFTENGSEKSSCLMEKIDGEPLERGNINFDTLDLQTRRKFINQAGKILSKIHSIQTKGFGWIIGQGKAQHKNCNDLIDELTVKKQKELHEMASTEGINLRDLQGALNIINNFRQRYQQVKPCLNHGDYSHKHFMVKNNQIVSILDWGGVRSDSPVYDFANWDYWFGEYIPTRWLKEGYSNKSLFDDNFEDFLHMIRLFKGLKILLWYHGQNYWPAVEKAKAKLLKDLTYFKNHTIRL